MSLRTRLTFWYGALLALALLSFSAILYVTLEQSLSANVNDTLKLRADQIRRVLGPRLGGLLQPEDVEPGQVERPLDEFAAPGIYVQVLNDRGDVVSAPPNLFGRQLPITPDSLQALRNGQQWSVTVSVPSELGDADVRVLTEPVLSPEGDVVGAVQVGQSLSPLQSTMAAVARLLILVGSLALVLAVGLGWLFTRRALRPVAQVTETARHIAATGDYRQRLPERFGNPRKGDELTFLASTFNAMIARLEQVLDSQHRLLADTSHELRNPLTVIRGNLAILRREGVPREKVREAVEESEEEAARMGRLVNDLLLLARADAGELPKSDRLPVNLAELASTVVEQARAAAGSRELTFQGAEPVTVLGDRDKLKQLVANLVENAIRYTPPSGRITVCVEAVPARAERVVQQPERPIRSSPGSRRTNLKAEPPRMTTAQLTVTDTGIGIDAQHLPHVFERFYRADKARSRMEGGTGLGLSIAQYVAHSHGGTLQAFSEGTNQGSSFVLRLPLVAATQAPSPTPTESPRRSAAEALAASLVHGGRR